MNLAIALGGFNEEKKIVKKDNNQSLQSVRGFGLANTAKVAFFKVPFLEALEWEARGNVPSV